VFLCARKNYEMNKCLSLVHLTRRATYLIDNLDTVAWEGVEPWASAFSGLR
jgi:hypothetical protein